jgi:hypothetical protein
MHKAKHQIVVTGTSKALIAIMHHVSSHIPDIGSGCTGITHSIVKRMMVKNSE